MTEKDEEITALRKELAVSEPSDLFDVLLLLLCILFVQKKEVAFNEVKEELTVNQVKLIGLEKENAMLRKDRRRTDAKSKASLQVEDSKVKSRHLHTLYAYVVVLR